MDSSQVVLAGIFVQNVIAVQVLDVDLRLDRAKRLLLTLDLVDLHAVVDGVRQLVAAQVVHAVQHQTLVMAQTALHLRQFLVQLHLLDVLVGVDILQLLFAALHLEVAWGSHLGVDAVVATVQLLEVLLGARVGDDVFDVRTVTGDDLLGLGGVRHELVDVVEVVVPYHLETWLLIVQGHHRVTSVAFVLQFVVVGVQLDLSFVVAVLVGLDGV